MGCMLGGKEEGYQSVDKHEESREKRSWGAVKQNIEQGKARGKRRGLVEESEGNGTEEGKGDGQKSLEGVNYCLNLN